MSVRSRVIDGRVMIVGGGPTGMSAALMLERKGYRDITVLEKTGYDEFETDRSYQYLIDGRGQRLTDMLGLSSSIAQQGVSSQFFRNITGILN